MKSKIVILLAFFVAVLIGGFFIFSEEVKTPEWVNTKSDIILVNNIVAGQQIISPLTVRGEARGYWFFEASFPVEVRDGSGNVLGRGIATAEGEWMTEEFVPFSATIEFSPGGNTEGFLALVKDNPSGLPEHDDELLIPVNF